jgi:CBS domain-containing protein
MRLREIVHAHIPYLYRESTVRDAIDKMDVYQFPALVIVDEEVRPLAVVTEGDLVRAAAKLDNLSRMAGDPVMAYATHDPTTAMAESEISDAYYLMTMSGLTILPVTDEGILIGVVLRVDLMQALLTDAAEGPMPERIT